MGYYTRHWLKIQDGSKADLTCGEILNKTIEKLTELDVMDYALDENLYPYDGVKWYDHKDHMKILSNEIKNVVFLLEGEGEESGDIWKEYWLNGRYQRCDAQIWFDEFDERKLESL